MKNKKARKPLKISEPFKNYHPFYENRNNNREQI